MSIKADEMNCVSEFRRGVEEHLRGDARLGAAVRDDRADSSQLTTRFPAGEKLWLEVIVRPGIPQVKVGIMTDDRWINEELEESIEETGDTMEEFIEFGFDEAGLDWRCPIVEHYRDQGKFFCFHTSLDLQSVTDLRSEATLTKVVQMLNGYAIAFAKPIAKAAGAR